MFRYTYYIEYFIASEPNTKYYGYYSCNEELQESIILTHKEVATFDITPLSTLADFLVYGKYLSNEALASIHKIREEDTYSIIVNILSKHTNKFEFNSYISNDMYLILDRTFRAISLIEDKNISTDEVESIVNLLNDKLPKIEQYSNYLLIQAEIDFRLYIRRKKSILFCKRIAQEIIRLIGKENIRIYDRIDPSLLDKLHIKLYNSLYTSLKTIGQVIFRMTSIFGFAYEYSACISLKGYFNRILEYLSLELDEDFPQNFLTNNAVKKKIITKEYSKQEVLEKLSPSYMNRNKVEIILNEVDENYHIKDCSKLDKACLALLLRENCNFLDQNLSKKFAQLRKLILQYYEEADVSYKENDCKLRKEELYAQYLTFWKKMRNKGSYM